jgi:hypothetical protein
MSLQQVQMDEKIKMAICQAIYNLDTIEAKGDYERKFIKNRMSEICSFVISSIEDLDTSDLNETFEESEEN